MLPILQAVVVIVLITMAVVCSKKTSELKSENAQCKRDLEIVADELKREKERSSAFSGKASELLGQNEKLKEAAAESDREFRACDLTLQNMEARVVHFTASQSSDSKHSPAMKLCNKAKSFLYKDEDGNLCLDILKHVDDDV